MRWIIRGIGALLLIIVVMLGSLFLLPGDRIARIASDQLSRMTGRAVSITGDVGVGPGHGAVKADPPHTQAGVAPV